MTSKVKQSSPLLTQRPLISFFPDYNQRFVKLNVNFSFRHFGMQKFLLVRTELPNVKRLDHTFIKQFSLCKSSEIIPKRHIILLKTFIINTTILELNTIILMFRITKIILKKLFNMRKFYTNFKKHSLRTYPKFILTNTKFSTNPSSNRTS